jgi:hypothetical protein
LEKEINAKNLEVEKLRQSLETEQASLRECSSKISKQAAQIEELQREVDIHKKGEQSLSREIEELRSKLSETHS